MPYNTMGAIIIVGKSWHFQHHSGY
jgi:hypothetical protein